ncbi:hypothetical protein CHUAL_008199 [Chamberlinius hualienensis]
MAEGVQKRLQQEIESYKTVRKDYQKVLSARQQLHGQLMENNVVKEELDRLESDANVYKLIGPVLIKQDLQESKHNVDKRIEYINNEIKRQDNIISELTKKQEGHQESLEKLQQQLQQAQIKAAMKA